MPQNGVREILEFTNATSVCDPMKLECNNAIVVQTRTILKLKFQSWPRCRWMDEKPLVCTSTIPSSVLQVTELKSQR